MLINLKSGLKKSKSQLLQAIDVFCSYGYEVQTYITQAKNDAYDYLMKRSDDYDIICVFGGDGTMNEVSNALMRKQNKPLLGYFPSGTMNDFGSNFNLGNNFKDIALKIVKGDYQYFDVGKFNDRYFNYVAAFGAMCDVPFTTKRDAKESLGNIAYIIEGISKLSEIKRTPVEYEINGKAYKSNALFGLIYSGNRVAGMQLDSAKNSRIDDGLFNVLIVDYVPGIFDSPDLFTTILQQKQFIHRYRCQNITLHFKDDVTCTLDGEEAKITNTTSISIINKALKILA